MMTIKIDASLTDALTLRVAEGLKRIEFFFGLSAHDFNWVAEPSFPLPEAISSKLVAICGEHGFADFLLGQITRKLEADPSYNPPDTDNLVDTDSFRDQIAASRELVEGLKSLPYKYRLSVPLPEAFSKEYGSLCQDFELGPGVSIVGGAILASEFPTRTQVDQRNRALEHSGGPENHIIPNTELLYLAQRNSGYVGGDKNPPIVADFRSTLRQFLGIALAVGAIKDSWQHDSPTGAYVVHRVDGEAEIVAAEKLPQQILNFYGRLMPSEPPKNEAEMAAARRRLNAIKSAFASDDRGRRLSVAAMWYLRSVLSQETLDAVLEATISIEALFGGGGSEGTKVSAILANRCAYRIGRSVSQRESILSQFSEIYNLRSRIVHEGHHRFNAKERALLKEARDICRRSLVMEATLEA
jgi:hypothetical protein